MIRHVLQAHSRGCGPACLAMLTGDDYESVCRTVAPEGSLHERGIYLQDIDDYLADRGLAVVRKKRFAGYRGQRAERYPWPPEPFADVHLVELRVAPDSPCWHFVVWLRDGTVLDPLTTESRRLSDYHEIANVAGVYRVGDAIQ